MRYDACLRPDTLLVAPIVAALAQLVEHIIRNDGVTGSSPVSGTIFLFANGREWLQKPLKSLKKSVLMDGRLPTVAHRCCTLARPKLT